MITEKDLNPHGYGVDQEQANNLKRLLYLVNAVQALYGKPLTVSNGLRSKKDQIRIDTQAGRKPRLGSTHIKGAGVDLVDGTKGCKDFKNWCVQNQPILQGLRLYREHFDYTPRHVHLQSLPPKSGNYVYIPY